MFYIMNKDHILGLYDDLSHFCQTGKLKQADYSGYSRELEIIVKKFSSDCDRSKNDNVFIVEDCRITSNDSDYSNFLYMALITLFGRSDFDLDYALKLYNYFILAAIERQDELHDAGYDEYIIDRMCLDHVFNGVVYNIIISNTNKDVDDIHLHSSATVWLMTFPSALPFISAITAFMMAPLFLVARTSANFSWM